jgi:hypothetical protein
MPSGAVKVEEWVDLETDTSFRFFAGSRWIVDRHDRNRDIKVQIAGVQRPDGSVARDIVAHLPAADESLTVAHACQLAAALLNAADGAEQMDGYDQITVS